MAKAAPLPKFDDWTPPWGADSDEIDADKLARYIHGLLSDKEKLQAKVTASEAKVTEAEAERDEAKRALAEADAKGADEKLTAATARAEKAETELKAARADVLKYEVALDEGLTKVQAKRLVGNTAEELKADAEELLESFGGAGRRPDDEGDGDDDGVPTRTPRSLRNPVDTGDGEDPNTKVDPVKWVEGLGRGSFI